MLCEELSYQKLSLLFFAQWEITCNNNSCFSMEIYSYLKNNYFKF